MAEDRWGKEPRLRTKTPEEDLALIEFTMARVLFRHRIIRAQEGLTVSSWSLLDEAEQDKRWMQLIEKSEQLMGDDEYCSDLERDFRIAPDHHRDRNRYPQE